jgi:hypothetical protein
VLASKVSLLSIRKSIDRTFILLLLLLINKLLSLFYQISILWFVTGKNIAEGEWPT